MKSFIKKYWPSLAHTVAVGVIWLNPSVQAFASANPKSAAAGTLGVMVWGYILHWAESPASNYQGVQNPKA